MRNLAKSLCVHVTVLLYYTMLLPVFQYIWSDNKFLSRFVEEEFITKVRRALSGWVLVERHERGSDRLRQVAQRGRDDRQALLLRRPQVGLGRLAHAAQVTF